MQLPKRFNLDYVAEDDWIPVAKVGTSNFYLAVNKKRSDFSVSLLSLLKCERAMKRIQNPNGFILQNGFTFYRKWVRFFCKKMGARVSDAPCADSLDCYADCTDFVDFRQRLPNLYAVLRLLPLLRHDARTLSGAAP